MPQACDCTHDSIANCRLCCINIINFAKLEEYYDFGGIRLEDDVLVTEDGARRTGPNRLPIQPDDVEAAMSCQ